AHRHRLDLCGARLPLHPRLRQCADAGDGQGRAQAAAIHFFPPHAGLAGLAARPSGGAMNDRYTIGFPYVADRFGGSTASSLVMARALKEAGHHIHVLTHGEDGRVAGEAAALDLPVARLPALSAEAGYARPDRFRFHQLTAFRAAHAAIGDLKLDIVHTNDLTMLRS